jgi:hypothetical protein
MNKTVQWFAADTQGIQVDFPSEECPCCCKAHKFRILTDLYVVESLTKRLNEVVVQRLFARYTLLPNKYNSPISWVHNILSISTGDLAGKRQEDGVALMKGSLLRPYNQVCRDILKQYCRIVVGPSQSPLGGLHGSVDTECLHMC